MTRDDRRFRTWLAGQTNCADNAVASLARRHNRRNVRFDEFDSSVTKEAIFRARILWRASEATTRRSSKSSAGRAPRARSQRSDSCPGCQQSGGAVRVNRGHRSELWHRQCFEARRGRSTGRGGLHTSSEALSTARVT
jgi:hypothetical protein